MGQLVLQIAGTVIGGALGGPVGARIGGVLGAFLGNALFGEDTVREMPSLADLTTSSSAFGTAIPWVFGTQRVGTTMVWATDIVEVRTETSSGGKGGPSQTTITFSYFANAAFLTCRGVKVILKVWADGKLLRDTTGQGQIESDKFANLIVTYIGNETQEPDPTIQDDIGVDDTPAYRGTCYFVVHDFPLEDFGNRIPQFTTLITDASLSLPFVELDLTAEREAGDIPLMGSGIVSQGIFSQDGRYLITVGATIFDSLTQTLVKADPDFDTNAYNSGLGSKHVFDSNGNLYGATTSGFLFGRLYALTPLTWEFLYLGQILSNAIARLITISPQAGPAVPGALPSDRVCVMGVNGRLAVYQAVPSDFTDLLSSNGTGAALPKLKLVGDVFVSNFQPPAPPSGGWVCNVDGAAVTDREGFCWFLMSDNEPEATREMWLFKFDAWAGAFVLSTQVPQSNVIGIRSSGLAYDADLHRFAVPTDNSLNPVFIEQYDIATGVWRANPPEPGFWATDNGHWDGLIASNHKLWFKENNLSRFFFEYDFETHSITRSEDSFDWTSGIDVESVQYDEKQNAVIMIDEIVPPSMIWLFLDRQGLNSTDLQTIVDDVSAEVGLEASKLDTDALAPIEVKGFAINGRMPARNALEQLRGVFFFDATESDYKMKFILRGGDPIRTLTDIDLGASNSVDNITSLVNEARIQEVELPARVDFQYSDENFEYQQGSQYAKRADEAVVTIDQVRMDVAVVMDATEAKNVAEVRLYLPWVEREKKSIMLTQQHLVLDATDVILIDLDDGTSFEVYIFDVDTSVDGLIEVSGVLQRPETQTFRNTTVGAEAEGFTPDLITVLSGSTFYVMDIPLLQDSDEGSTPLLYSAAGRVGDVSASSNPVAWGGARIDRSFDSAIFTPWTFHPSASEVDHGFVVDALPAVTAPWVWDRTNTINVRMRNGTLSSLTEAQVLDGIGNAVLLGKEVIQFVTATLEVDGTYTLSTLLRARRGTDLYARAINGIDHSRNERFIVLTVASIQIKAHSVDNLNRLQSFRALTTGATGISTLQLTPVGQSKYPYAPYLVAGVRDGAGEVVLTWSRRTRLGGAVDWQLGPSEPPLSEDTEAYQVSVLDANGLEVRSIEVTAETATYTVAEQLSDFGTDLDPVEDTLDFIVYQISAVIGRGFPSETLNV